MKKFHVILLIFLMVILAVDIYVVFFMDKNVSSITPYNNLEDASDKTALNVDAEYKKDLKTFNASTPLKGLTIIYSNSVGEYSYEIHKKTYDGDFTILNFDMNGYLSNRVSPGNMVATFHSGFGKVITVWDKKSDETYFTFQTKPEDFIVDAIWSPDGSKLLILERSENATYQILVYETYSWIMSRKFVLANRPKFDEFVYLMFKRSSACVSWRMK